MLRKLGSKQFFFDTIHQWFADRSYMLALTMNESIVHTCRYQECGPVFKFWGIHNPIVLALDPECIKVRIQSFTVHMQNNESNYDDLSVLKLFLQWIVGTAQ